MRHGALAVLMATTLLSAVGGCGDGTLTPPAPRHAVGDLPEGLLAVPSVTPARRGRSVLSPEAPSLAELPSGRTVPIRPVGTSSKGELEVPDNIDVAAWWAGGSRLGDPFGSIVVAGHVDSATQGLGPFAELLTTSPGARIRLESTTLAQTFSVRSRRLVPQGSLAAESWIFEASGAPRLTLVTCAPPYDAEHGGYQNLAVVTAVPVSPVDRP